jgi:hypothetical protein
VGQVGAGVHDDHLGDGVAGEAGGRDVDGQHAQQGEQRGGPDRHRLGVSYYAQALTLGRGGGPRGRETTAAGQLPGPLSASPGARGVPRQSWRRTGCHALDIVRKGDDGSVGGRESHDRLVNAHGRP